MQQVVVGCDNTTVRHEVQIPLSFFCTKNTIPPLYAVCVNRDLLPSFLPLKLRKQQQQVQTSQQQQQQQDRARTTAAIAAAVGPVSVWCCWEMLLRICQTLCQRVQAGTRFCWRLPGWHCGRQRSSLSWQGCSADVSATVSA